jgi:hypothetical protein
MNQRPPFIPCSLSGFQFSSGSRPQAPSFLLSIKIPLQC